MEENAGQINLAFEATSEDTTKKDAKNHVPKHAFVVAEEEEKIKRSGLLAFLGLCTLPDFFQKKFLKPSWILVFLCWASTTQVSEK